MENTTKSKYWKHKPKKLKTRKDARRQDFGICLVEILLTSIACQLATYRMSDFGLKNVIYVRMMLHEYSWWIMSRHDASWDHEYSWCIVSIIQDASWVHFGGVHNAAVPCLSSKHRLLELVPGFPGSCSSTLRHLPSTHAGGQDDVGSDKTPSRESTLFG